MTGDFVQPEPAAPKRIQRKRTKGWRMPEGAVYVGRPSVWGNPYRVWGQAPRAATPEEAVELFRRRIDYAPDALGPYSAAMIRRLLGGRDLCCWCPLDAPCHADVLLEIANSERAS